MERGNKERGDIGRENIERGSKESGDIKKGNIESARARANSAYVSLV